MEKWDHRFMALAAEAASWSKDPDCQVGAVLVSPDHRQFSFGYNGFPSAFDDLPEIFADKARKNALTVHAEVNAILNAPVTVAGWTLYCTKAPCISCATILAQAKVARIFCPALDCTSKWFDSMLQANDLLAACGIHCHYI